MLDQLLNFISITAWIIFAVFVFFTVLRAFQYGGLQEGIRSLGRPWIIISLLVVLSISLLSASLVFIEPQETGVVVSLTSPDGYRQQPLRSGLHWIVPLAERVVQYPIYWQNFTMSSDPLEGNKVGNDSTAARTSDGQSVYIDSSIIYRLDPNEVIRVHIDLQDRYVEDFIRPLLRGTIRTEVSQFTAEEVNSSKRKDLEKSLQDQIRQALSDKGFILDRFLLRNIAFSSQYASAIEQKQIAEQERIQKEYQAEQMRKLAEGERDKTRLEAQGKADAAVLEGEAAAKVILLKAQAQAEALRLINEILQQNKDLITYEYVQKIAPGVKVMLLPSNNPYILSIPDMGLNESGVTAGSTISPTVTLPAGSSLPGAPTPIPTPMLTPTPGR
jgi:regulator of protease activity HflC (stomatin/prohibitin superfamily)